MTRMNREEQRAAREKNSDIDLAIVTEMRNSICTPKQIAAWLMLPAKLVSRRLLYLEKFDFVHRVDGKWKVT